MPTYAYACTECSHQFEAQQAFTDDALTECPECTGRLRKIFNAVGIVFKGSGFYRTDSRAKNGASSQGGSAASSSSSSGSSESSSGSAESSSRSSDGGSAGSGSSTATSAASSSTPKHSAPKSSAA